MKSRPRRTARARSASVKRVTWPRASRPGSDAKRQTTASTSLRLSDIGFLKMAFFKSAGRRIITPMAQLFALVWLKWTLLRNSLRSRKAVAGRVAAALGVVLGLTLSLAVALGVGAGAYFLSAEAS